MLTLLVSDHKPSAPLPTACQHLALPLLSLRQRTRCRAPCAARVQERSGDTVGVWREREAERERERRVQRVRSLQYFKAVHCTVSKAERYRESECLPWNLQSRGHRPYLCFTQSFGGPHTPNCAHPVHAPSVTHAPTHVTQLTVYFNFPQAPAGSPAREDL